MTNSTILIKVKNRLNKLASNDYTNIESWQIIEAFNKGMLDWCRRNAHGNNLYREGAEQSTSRIDDLQRLLPSAPVLFSVKDFGTYAETTTSLPSDYMRFNRFSATATFEDCNIPQPLMVYLAEAANEEIYLRDKNRQPNFAWRETFATIKNNKIQIFTDGKITVKSLGLLYYRKPILIQIAGVKDPYTGIIPTVDVECEFNDTLAEVLVDECAKIIAADTENFAQSQRLSQEAENDN